MTKTIAVNVRTLLRVPGTVSRTTVNRIDILEHLSLVCMSVASAYYAARAIPNDCVKELADPSDKTALMSLKHHDTREHTYNTVLPLRLEEICLGVFNKWYVSCTIKQGSP
jgi:hypothetical protein